ncbi:translation initiation factor IF-2-like [Vitis riparia]|uniref:translation initiation factor IF-2-like n=1 Tax=Vitis riparia TaxID=96939 RepID=UPI00155AF2F2|nr:translation initiation factor IF-2-like [Vitis riparia]
MTDNRAAKGISETPISDVGNWTEDGDRVQINITGAGKDVKLSIAQPPPKKPLEMTIPKQQPVVTEKPKEESDKQKKEVEKTKEESDKQKKEVEKPKEEGSGIEKKGGQESKRDETVLENVMTKLKSYKGIVITAFIVISLGYLLRRKFKVA